jgi:predicted DNA-binding transcriptional regulator AlpA
VDGNKLLLSRDDLKQLGIPFSRWTLRRLAAKGEFPASIRLSHNCVAWRRDQIMEWLNAKTSSSRK